MANQVFMLQKYTKNANFYLAWLCEKSGDGLRLRNRTALKFLVKNRHGIIGVDSFGHANELDDRLRLDEQLGTFGHGFVQPLIVILHGKAERRSVQLLSKAVPRQPFAAILRRITVVAD